jgi:microcystin-dependent protein
MPQTSLLHSSIGDLKQGGQLIPTGTVLAYAGVSAPSGWLVCDGAAYNQADYADLFAALSTTYNTQLNPTTGSAWAAPSASQFRVPDLRGLFLRGAGTPSGQSAVTVGSHQDQSTAKNGLALTNNTVASSSHGHSLVSSPGANLTVQAVTTGSVNRAVQTQTAPSTDLGSNTGSPSGTTTVGISNGDLETRPMNRGVTYIIKI